MKPKKYNSNTLYERILTVLNESADDKYTHIGYGHYKLKGKEKDPNATVFSKEGNKYVPTKKDEPAGGKSKVEPAKPKVNIFDKPKQPSYFGGDKNSADFNPRSDVKAFQTALGKDFDYDENNGITTFTDGNENTITIGSPQNMDSESFQTSGFAVAGYNAGKYTGKTNYKVFDKKEDAVSYASKLAKKLKSSGTTKKPTTTKPTTYPDWMKKGHAVASALDGSMSTDELNKFFNKKHNRNVTEKDLDDYLNTYLNDKFIRGVWKDKGVNITGFRNSMKKLKSKLFSK